MKRRLLVFILLIVLLVPFVSADFLGIGAGWNKIKTVTKGWDPGYTAIGVIVFVFIFMGFLGRGIAHHRAEARRSYQGGYGEGSGLGRKLLGAATLGLFGGGWWLSKKGVSGGWWASRKIAGGGLLATKKSIGILKDLREERLKKRDIENRMRVAEQQLEKYEAYLVWQEGALEKKVLDKETQIRNLAHMEQNLISELNGLATEFNKILAYLQTGRRNQELINRATSIRNRITGLLQGIYRIAAVLKSRIEEQEKVEREVLIKEERSRRMMRREERIENAEEGQIIDEIGIDKKAGNVEGVAGAKSRAARRKAAGERRRTHKQEILAGRKKRATRKAERETVKQIDIDKEKERALETIQQRVRAMIQMPNNPLSRQNLDDINKAMRVIFPRRDIIQIEAEHIQRLHAGIARLNRKGLRMESKKRWLGQLADSLFEKGVKKGGAVLAKIGREQRRMAA